jgi:hypothetical protein
MKNWKTTVLGIAAIVAVASKVITSGQFDFNNDVPAILAGIGLLHASDAQK